MEEFRLKGWLCELFNSLSVFVLGSNPLIQCSWSNLNRVFFRHFKIKLKKKPIYKFLKKYVISCTVVWNLNFKYKEDPLITFNLWLRRLVRSDLAALPWLECLNLPQRWAKQWFHSRSSVVFFVVLPSKCCSPACAVIGCGLHLWWMSYAILSFNDDFMWSRSSVMTLYGFTL